MGNFFSQTFDRLFDYPLKRRRFCVYRKEDFTVTGEFLGFNTGEQHFTSHVQSEYEELVNDFNSKLLQKRRENFERKRRGEEDDTLLKKFPEWNATTVSYLHSLFLMFCDEKSKKLDYKGFEYILECLGDDSPVDIRKNRFNFVDQDGNGFINYMNFLYILYNFDTPVKDTGTGLANMCVRVAEKTQFVNSLSIAKQLEYGFF